MGRNLKTAALFESGFSGELHPGIEKYTPRATHVGDLVVRIGLTANDDEVDRGRVWPTRDQGIVLEMGRRATRSRPSLRLDRFSLPLKLDF